VPEHVPAFPAANPRLRHRLHNHNHESTLV
jgi:hypothetical protein